MQPYKNDIPLGEPEPFDQDKLDEYLNSGLSDEVRVMNSKKAVERKKQYREWRKIMFKKSTNAKT